jgi:autotransporter translocation and assembly factor TamB
VVQELAPGEARVEPGNVLDGELRVGRLGGTLWTGVTLDNLELLNREGQVMKADHVRVRYDPFTLARRRWIVDKVVIERPASPSPKQPAAGTCSI